MATILKRLSARTGKISWHARVRRKNHNLTKTFSRKADAQFWARSVEAAIDRGALPDSAQSRNRTVSDLLDLYEPHILQELKDATNRLYHLDHWRSEIGHIKLIELTPKHIKDYSDQLSTTVSPATTNRYVASLSAALTYAVKELYWLEKNPAFNVKKRTEPKARNRFLNDKERRDLIQAGSSLPKFPEMLPIIYLAITTGMRKSEILNLTWDDCDFTQRRITIRESKNGEQRVVPLLGPAFDELSRWAKIRPIDSNLHIFPSRRSPASKKLLDIDHSWRLVRDAAGLVNFRFHDLRHTAASYLAMSGASLLEIGDILGHKSQSVTMRYAHLTNDHKQKTVLRMIEQKLGAENVCG